MTTPYRGEKEHESPFSKWVRLHPDLDSIAQRLSVMDTDMWFHRFSERNKSRLAKATDVRLLVECIQNVEIKTYACIPDGRSGFRFSRDVPFAQSDTLSVIDGIARHATVINGRRRHIQIPDTRKLGSVRHVRWFGAHVLQMSDASPDRSKIIVWDGKHQISESVLIEILRFDRDPDHIERMLDTRLHHRPALKTIPGGLFGKAMP